MKRVDQRVDGGQAVFSREIGEVGIPRGGQGGWNARGWTGCGEGVNRVPADVSRNSGKRILLLSKRKAGQPLLTTPRLF